MKYLIASIGLLLCLQATPQTQSPFPLVGPSGAADIYVSPSDHWLVQHAAELLSLDIQKITGRQPMIRHTLPASARFLIIIGSLDQNPLIEKIAAKNSAALTAIRHKWEAFATGTCDHPAPGIEKALIITGSDRRGTAYGVFDLSSRIGISPWYWWADVPIPAQKYLYTSPAWRTDSPTVKYRGFFINDEAPALSGWAREKFGGVNHLLYEKVFELLLRLKANYLWPAMWGNAFNTDDTLNPVLADKYGIVMGSSHHEPMLRAQQEWKKFGSGPWDYEKNTAVLDSFWTTGIRNMGSHESIVTIGMRGDGDMPMTEKSNISLLEKIVADQRAIIGRVTGRPPSHTPQLWALYKEVQDYYDKGMRVPDDVTLLLCDDNWGNIRKLPARNSPPRAGGYGIYYHFDYVGAPRNYKWLNTNLIDRVQQQMQLAWEYGADRCWIVNVGDIKPMEFPTEFFLDYAWNPARWPADSLHAYTLQWTTRQFGPQHADAIAGILEKYTRYNARRKPELLSPDTYSLLHYREAETVTEDYTHLARITDSVGLLLPPQYNDAFYQLVRYPVLACANLNDLYTTVAANRLYAAQHRIATDSLAARAHSLYQNDSLLACYYNDSLANGKWRHMMDQTHIGYTYWQQPPFNTMPAVATNHPLPANTPSWDISPEDTASSQILIFPYSPLRHYFEIFNRTAAPLSCTIHTDTSLLHISSPAALNISSQQRIWISPDWPKIPKGINRIPITVISSDGSSRSVTIVLNNPPILSSQPPSGFIQSDGFVSIDAAHFARRTGDTLEYEIYLTDTGNVKIWTYFAPPLDFTGLGLYYQIGFDAEILQRIKIPDISSGRLWEISVSNNTFIDSSIQHISIPGKHILRFSADPGIMLKKILLDKGGVKESYLGPPESTFL